MMKIHPVSGPGYLTYVREKSEGYWVGTGAKILALPEQVAAKEWRAVRLGIDPETGEPLRSQRLVDRVYQKPWGEQIYKARQMFDICLNAPKTVSVMSFDTRVLEAHERAVEKTWRFMEQQCGAMVLAAFPHHYSRTLDPQEHTHLVAGNLAFDGNKWRTLHVNNLYRVQGEVTEYYREHLLGQLEREGYRVNYPELADVPAGIAERFSQRARELDKGLLEYSQIRGVPPERITHREVNFIARDYRSAKVVLPREHVRELHLAMMAPAERDHLLRVREEAGRHRERMRLSSHVQSEPEQQREHWGYGERISL